MRWHVPAGGLVPPLYLHESLGPTSRGAAAEEAPPAKWQRRMRTLFKKEVCMGACTCGCASWERGQARSFAFSSEGQGLWQECVTKPFEIVICVGEAVWRAGS